MHFLLRRSRLSTTASRERELGHHGGVSAAALAAACMRACLPLLAAVPTSYWEVWRSLYSAAVDQWATWQLHRCGPPFRGCFCLRVCQSSWFRGSWCAPASGEAADDVTRPGSGQGGLGFVEITRVSCCVGAQRTGANNASFVVIWRVFRRDASEIAHPGVT